MDAALKSLNLTGLREIRAAIDKFINRTPCIYSEELSERIGKPVYLKMENLQITGAFKARGNAYKLSTLSDEELKNGVVTASSGNHGLGMSAAARRRLVPARVFVPVGTPQIKIDKLKKYGAEVSIQGATYDEAVVLAQQTAEKDGSLYISSFEDVNIIKGNTTIGLEIFEDVPTPGLVIVPIGGGGGISGVSLARNIMSPKTKIMGAEVIGAASMFHSLKAGKRQALKEISTLADGIKVAQPGQLAFGLAQKYVEEVITVNEEDLQNTLRELVVKAKIVPELAGCASVAALDKIDVKSFEGPIVCMISGGNIDLQLLNKILGN